VPTQADQVGPVAGQDPEHLVDVAGPGTRAAVAVGLLHGPREDVVEDDHARPRRQPLDADEVAQRELGQVHAVDEREVGLLRAERLERLRPREELVAGLAQQLHVVAELDAQVVGRVDAERGTVGQREAVAVAQADLEVGAGADGLVQALEEVEVLHGSGP
jgi:hypothetical protein